MSLRSTLTMTTLLVTTLAVLIAGALIVLTTALHRATTAIGASVESVRLAEEAEIELLLHERAKDPVVKREIESNLRRKLGKAWQFVTTEEEALILRGAESRVDAYVASAHAAPQAAEEAARHEEAYAALEALVTINVEQSKLAQQRATRWDDLANVLGFGLGALLVVVTGMLLLWLRARAFAPILGLAAAMERFGRGDRSVRATEDGPRELRDMCARFNEMASSLAAQRQAQMAFLGGVAHELRNPLSTLRLAVALLEDPGSPTSHHVRQAAERIGRNVTRMERMLEDLLDITKIEAGSLELRLGLHDARTIVEQAVELFEGPSRAHRLDVHLPDAPMPIRCDHIRIEQVITNLVSNAVKYSPAGSSVEVSLRAGATELELSVVDHGVGISAQDLDRVFEPFRRVGSRKETIPGVGLGLFVVRKLVEAHGGRIEVESRCGAGSTFRVLLPMTPTEPRARATA